jgi:ubiquinone/menaquinone biosynthesis C-methylase UbiE
MKRAYLTFIGICFIAVAAIAGPALSERAVLLARVEGQQAQRTPEEYAKFLEGADRVARMQVPRVVSTLGLKPGMKVADIGSGSGLFTRPIARAVGPKGVAFAVDIDPALLKIVERGAADEKIANVRTILGTAGDPRLPEPVDLVFVCDTLHHIEKPAAYLQTLKKYLTPEGRIAVIDFTEKWPQGHEPMRYSLEQLEGWMKAAGMTRVASHSWLDNSFFVIYRLATE